MMISNILSLIFLAGDIAICIAPEYQESPSVAFDGNNYLVVWQDKRSGDCDIWGQFISHEGTLVDTNFPICVAESNQVSPCVCFGTSNYLVIWCDGRGDSTKIYGQRISPVGTLIDIEFIINDNGVGDLPDIVFDDTNFMVVWRDYHDLGKDQVCGRRISQDGIPIDTSFLIPITGSDREHPHVAFSDTNYLVVWENISNPANIYGCIISTSGVPSDTVFPIIEKNATSMIIPDVASCGENYLVVTIARDTLFGRLVSLNGEPIGEPFSISAESTRIRSSVIWADSAYLVMWEKKIGDVDIYGRWLSSTGTFLNTEFAITTGGLAEYRPQAVRGDSNCLIVWADTRDFDYDIYGTIISTLGVEEHRSQVASHRLQVYPNPFTQSTIIRFEDSRFQIEDCKVQVYDMVGRLVEETDESVIGKNLHAGIYFVKAREYKPIKIVKLR